MKRLTIGVDIDGVIVDYAAVMLPIASEICGRPVTLQDLRSWNLMEALDISEKQFKRLWEWYRPAAICPTNRRGYSRPFITR